MPSCSVGAGPEWECNPKHAPPKEGEPALHRAARVGDLGELSRLLASGADPDSVFDIGLDPGAYPWPATPLMVASGSGDGATVETVRLLLSKGADPKLRTDAGRGDVRMLGSWLELSPWGRR
jgi:ankyrin repeat protein